MASIKDEEKKRKGKVLVKKENSSSASSAGSGLKAPSSSSSSGSSKNSSGSVASVRKSIGTQVSAARKQNTSASSRISRDPTETEMLAHIMKVGESNDEEGRRLYGLYGQAKEQGHWKETYDKATSPYLTALGITDPSQINDDFFAANSHLYTPGVHTATGALSSAKRNGPEAMLAYNLSGLQEDYYATKEMQAEQDQMVAEARYWMDKGLTDEEIKKKLNIGGTGSKYTKIGSAMERSAKGEFTPTTAPIWAATSWGVDGMLWSLRNPDQATGDYFTDAIKRDMGQGKAAYTDTPENIARRTPGSATWAPYSNGTTMDKEAILFGVSKFDQKWLDDNRQRILASGDQKMIDAFGKVWEAEQKTREAEAETADWRNEVQMKLEDGLSPEEIFSDPSFQTKFPVLVEMQEGIYKGTPVSVTRTVDFDPYAMRQEAEAYYALSQAQKNAPVDPAAMQTAVEAEKQAVVDANGTLSEPETTPKSRTNTQVIILDKKPQAIAKGGITWAGLGFKSDIRPQNYMVDEYANWTDAQKMAAQGYITDFKDGEDTTLAIEDMKMAGLTQEQIDRFIESDMVKPAEETPEVQEEPAPAEEPAAETVAPSEEAEAPVAESDNPFAPSPEEIAELAPFFDSEEDARNYIERQNAMNAVHASINEGDFMTAAEIQYGLISSMLEGSDDAYAQELIHSEGSQEAAASLMAMVMESGMPKMLDDADIRAQLSVFEGYANEAFGIEQKPLTDFVTFVDRMLNMKGALIAAQENEGLGITAMLQMALDRTAYTITDLADKFIGSVVIGAGELTGNEGWVEKGKEISSEMDAKLDAHNALLMQNGTPLEILGAQTISEMTKMHTFGKASEFLNAGASIAFSGKFKWLTRFISSTPFAAESGVREFDETYEETGGDFLTSFLSSSAAAGTTMLMSRFDGILKNIEAKGMPFIPEVVKSLSAAPGSGVMAGAARWGKAFGSWLWNLAKTGINEAVQEPAENVVTTFLTDAIKGENPLDRDWEAYGKELIADGAMAFMLSLGSSVSTLPTYANSVKVAEAQMGKSQLTGDDVKAFVEALEADAKDATIVDEATNRATNIAVEAKTGELVAQGALPDVDTSKAEQAQEKLAAAEEKAADAAAVLANSDQELAIANERMNEDASDQNTAAVLQAIQSNTAAREADRKAQRELQKAQADAEAAQAEVEAQTAGAMDAVRAQAAAEVEQSKQERVVAKEQAEADSAETVNTSLSGTAPEDTGGDGPPVETAPTAGSNRLGVSQFASQTGQNTSALSDEVKQQLRESPYYKKTTQKKNVDDAITLIDSEGYEARKNKLLDGTTNVMTPEGQAEAYVLVKAAKANGDIEGESAIAFLVKESGTTLGQAMAMRRLYLEMTPAGKAKFVQRLVDQLNSDRAGGKNGKIEVPVWLEEQLTAVAGDEARTEAVLEEAYKNIASQMRPSISDRINTWRYLAMLGNPLTHSKNILANMAQAPYVMIKNKAAALGEVGVQVVRSVFGKETERTKSLRAIKGEYRSLAKEAYVEFESQLRGDPTTPMQKINDWRKKSWAWMDKLSRFNSDLMTREDMLFKRSYFVNAMASYLQANNVDAANPSAEMMAKASEYAFNEAMKNTFNNANAFAEWLSTAQADAKKRGGMMKLADVAISAIMPFKKTPANVIMRGIEYSPIGLLNSITMNTAKLIRGKDFSGKRYTVNQWIDSMASGLTGSLAVGMGAFLSSIGVLDLGSDEDDELRGTQENSINVMGHNLSIDSFGSSAMPLLMGAKVYDLWSDEDNEDGMFTRLLSVLGTIADPVMELSVMQGVNSLLSSASYSDNSLLAIGQRAGSSFVSQFVPSILGAIARTADETRRTVYVDKNKPQDSQTQYFLQSIRNKVPGLSESGMPYLDVWGNEVSNGDTMMRFLSNFIVPGYPKEQQDPDAVTQKLLELFDEMGDPAVLPKKAGTSFTVNKEKKNLTAEEYQKYAKDRGDRAKAILEGLFASEEFSAADDVHKLEAIEKTWEYATKMAAHGIDNGYKVSSDMLNAENPVEYILEKMREGIKSDLRAEYTQGVIDAIAVGDLESAEACVEGLRQTGMEDKTIKGRLTTQFKDRYRELNDSGDEDEVYDLKKSLILLDVGYRTSEIDKWLEKE